MLTPEQIDTLRDRAEDIARPITEYLLQDIARRISEAGQLTSTAAYQIFHMQQLGKSQKEIKSMLQKLLTKSEEEIANLLTQSAEVGYNFDLSALPTAAAIPFEQNETMQQIVSNAVKLAQDDFTNLTQTLGMVDPSGHAMPLQDAYRKCCDFAFQQVTTGAVDYNTAIRQATKNIADQGVRVIDYESGVHTSVEAATRRNVMGGLGLMQEEISQQNHDSFGANGWEISAHSASAPDHEPIQGKQYTDEEYQALNGSLQRRIGTLNCGHSAFPIVIGINEPQYTDEELEQMREENAAGIDYQGRHYSTYEATQKQRQIERSIRKQKNRILVDEAAGDGEKLMNDQIRLRRLNDEYKRFSKSADMPMQRERAQVAGFGKKNAARAEQKKFIDSVDQELKYQNKNAILKTKNEPMYRKQKIGKVEPMPRSQFLKIEKSFKAQGGVFQYGEETDRYLESKHAEAVTYDAKTILFKRHPGRASVFEELIHATQYRTGKNDGSYLCRLQCEIAAQKKLLKYSKAYSLTAVEIEQTKNALLSYENELKEYIGKG